MPVGAATKHRGFRKPHTSQWITAWGLSAQLDSPQHQYSYGLFVYSNEFIALPLIEKFPKSCCSKRAGERTGNSRTTDWRTAHEKSLVEFEGRHVVGLLLRPSRIVPGQINDWARFGCGTLVDEDQVAGRSTGQNPHATLDAFVKTVFPLP